MIVIGDHILNFSYIMKEKDQNPLLSNFYITSYYIVNIFEITILKWEIFKPHQT